MNNLTKVIGKIVLTFTLLSGLIGCNSTVGKTVSLKQITVSSKNAKTEFTVGEEYTSEGLKVTAEYSDGTTKQVEGWTVKGFDSSKPAENQLLTVTYTESSVTVTATYSVTIKAPQNETPVTYTVEHYQQNIADDEYTLVESDTESKKGIAGSDTQAEPKEYAGFTTEAFDQLMIESDGTTVVKIYYTRNTYTLRFDTDGGNTIEPLTLKYGAQITVPENPQKTEYTFGGWNAVIPSTMPAEDLSIKALWLNSDSVLYTVEHYQQNISDDEYTLVESDTERKSGAVNEDTEASARTYTGFSAKTFAQLKIAADGTTVVKIYYDRNTYTITYETEYAAAPDSKTVRYGYTLTDTDLSSLAQTGYVFIGWNKAAGEEITSDVMITASWTPAENPPEENPDLTAAYTVEHYKQNIADDEYTLVSADTESKKGTVNEYTEASAKIYAGFTAKAFDQKQIAAEGSTVIKIYYTRNTYTVSYSSLYGTAPESKTVRYGYTLTDTDLPNIIQAGYVFGGWNKAAGDTITAAVTITASWTPSANTSYKVEHYQQNVTDNSYTLVSADTENKIGTTLTDTSAASKSYIGFTAKTFAQLKIAADGTTTVKIYYDRNTYTVSYSSLYGTAPESKTVRYGYTLTSSDLPSLTQTGYVFGGWNKTAGETILASVTVTASWTPATNTAYKVEHYKQNVADNSYTLVSADTENKTGKTDSDTAATSKSYIGFTAKTFAQLKIAADGTTTVKIYYDRNTYTVSYSSLYGTAPESKTVRYGYTLTSSDLPSLTQTGYVFGGWNKTAGETISVSVTVTASWTPAANTAYKVEHYKQNVSDNNYTLVTADTENKTGTTLTDTAAASKTYAGFTAKSFNQKSIAADGSTAVKIYYDRNTYTVSYSSLYGTVPESKTVRYGYELTTADLPALTQTGYNFNGWNKSEGDTITSAVTVTASWIPATNTAYKVEHYKQNVADNSYTLVTADTENKTGTTLTDTAAASKTYAGFTAKSFTQKTIAADGTTTVKIYYDRNTYTITYETEYAAAPDSKTVRYGYTLTAADLPSLTQAGYVFSGWNKAAGDTITSAVTVTASWAPATNTAYRVEHYKQNVADNSYTLVTADTENKTGTTDSDTAAASKTYAGFTAKSFTQKAIAPDGTTVVKIYYDRNEYTISFDSAGGTTVTPITVKYGTAVTAPAAPSRNGYVFVNWSTAVPSTMPAADTTITAVWQKVESSFDINVDSYTPMKIKFTVYDDTDGIDNWKNFIFTVPTGYEEYLWFLDSNLCAANGNQFEYSTKDQHEAKKHELNVLVKDSNGDYDSARMTFVVDNSESF